MRLPRDLSGDRLARLLARHYGYSIIRTKGSHMTATKRKEHHDVREAAAELPDMNATARGDGIDTMRAGTNSHKPAPGIAEEANA